MLSHALGKGFGVDKIMTMTRDFQSSLRIKPAFGEKKNRAGPTPGKREKSKLPESNDIPMLVSTSSPKRPLIQQENFQRDQYGRETGFEMEEATLDAYTPPSARLVRQGSIQLNEYGCQTGLEMEDATYPQGSSTSVTDLQEPPPTITKQVAWNIKNAFGTAIKSITKIRWKRNGNAPPRNLNHQFDKEALDSSKKRGLFALNFYRRTRELVAGRGETGHYPSDSADSVESSTAKVRKAVRTLREAVDSGSIVDEELRLQLNSIAINLLGLANNEEENDAHIVNINFKSPNGKKKKNKVFMKLFDPRKSKKKAQDDNRKKNIREKASYLTEVLNQICAGDNIIDEQKEIVEKLVTKEFGGRVLWQEFLFSTEEVIAIREAGGAGTSTTSICKILDAMKDLLGIGRITPPMIKKKIAQKEKEALKARYVNFCVVYDLFSIAFDSNCFFSAIAMKLLYLKLAKKTTCRNAGLAWCIPLKIWSV
jgi:hypothetical protein